jgi:hypothetical protein
MNLPEIAFQGGWRDLVTPGLTRALHRLEAQGVVFAWAAAEPALPETYVFSARLQETVLASQDGTETPRQAISEVILGAMTACGAFPGQRVPLPQNVSQNPARTRLEPVR